jgi:hypothetical protein
VYSLLQKLGKAARREVVQNSMHQEQRLALESYVKSKRDHLRAGNRKHTPAICDAHDDVRATVGTPKCRGGICKSADGGKVYGYYAKVTCNNLTFIAHIHTELSCAIRDHIIIMKMLDKLPPGRNDEVFASELRHIVKSICAVEQLLDRAFFRSVAVTFSAHHWIGRAITVYIEDFSEAVDVWNTFNLAQTPRLFVNGKPTLAYTPDRAAAQWSKLKAAFCNVQICKGRLRKEVEMQLLRMEAAHRHKFYKNAARWNCFCQTAASRKRRRSKGDKEQKLLHRLQNAIWRWHLEIAKKKRIDELAAAREAKIRRLSLMKRMWDGKESRDEFDRRVRLCC